MPVVVVVISILSLAALAPVGWNLAAGGRAESDEPVRAEVTIQDDDSATEEEISHCRGGVLNAARCAESLRLAMEARSRAARRYSQSAPDGPADAFRHCLWSGLMARSMGAQEARGFGDRHEAREPAAGESRSAFERSRAMDLANNAIGRRIGESNSAQAQIADACERQAEPAGALTVLRR